MIYISGLTCVTDIIFPESIKTFINI